MAFGHNWEWRGFGKPEAELRSRIFGLRPKFPKPQELLDEYLWAPGCGVNVKLREGSLKFKRLEAKTESLERWHEPRGENHRFPLATEVVGKLLADLLKKSGCSSQVFLKAPWTVALGGDTSLGGSAIHPPSGAAAVRLSRAPAPGAGRFLESTPIVPFDTWYPLQQKRIRYFKKPAKEAGGDENQ